MGALPNIKRDRLGRPTAVFGARQSKALNPVNSSNALDGSGTENTYRALLSRSASTTCTVPLPAIFWILVPNYDWPVIVNGPSPEKKETSGS